MPSDIWDKLFKNGTSKICGRQPYFLMAAFHKFTWSILEYFVSYVVLFISPYQEINSVCTAYHLSSAVYLCDNTEVWDFGTVISNYFFEKYIIKCISKSVLLVKRHIFVRITYLKTYRLKILNSFHLWTT